MERYSMFLGWKIQYFENDCTTKGNQQIQYNSYQITNGTFHNSVQFSHSVVSDSFWPHEPKHARPPCPSSTLRVYPNSCPLSQWCHPTVSPSGVPFCSGPNPSQHQSLFQWVNSSHEVAKVLEFQLWHHSFQRNPRVDLLQNGFVGSPCSPRNSQESSPRPQFKSINS